MAPENSVSRLASAQETSRKRPRESADCGLRRTRAKLSPPDSSSASSLSASDVESALMPTSISEASTDASDVDPSSDSDSDLDDSSSEPSSESSSDDDSEDSDSDLEQEAEDEDGFVNLIANRGRKPNMKLDKKGGPTELISRLKSFLPKLAAANEELEEARKAGTLEERTIEVDEDGAGQYIEMDLGLGVLEQQDPDGQSSNADDDVKSHDDPDEKDILGKLMGREKRKEPAGIEEI